MSDTQPRNAIKNRSFSRFWIALVLALCVTASYPVAMLVTFPIEHVFAYLRHEVAWSFHAIFLLPIAVGLLAWAFKLGFFLEITFWKRCAWVLIFFVPVVPMIFAVIADIQVIPTPDRVSSANGLQKFAIEVDQCLRSPGECKEPGKYLAFVPECRDKYGTRFKALRINGGYLKDEELDSLRKNFEKRHAYFCALLNKAGGFSIEENFIKIFMILLKFTLIIFVWSFVYYTLFMAINHFFKVDRSTLYPLIGCFIIFISWFPCQLYAEWHRWYGDLSHIRYFYDAFWVLLMIAFLLLLLFVAWTVVLIKGANFVTTVAAVHSTMIAVFAIVFGIKPRIVDVLFGIFGRLNDHIFVILMFIVLLYMIVYIRLVITAGARENTS